MAVQRLIVGLQGLKTSVPIVLHRESRPEIATLGEALPFVIR
jgi:hypothetical protein